MSLFRLLLLLLLFFSVKLNLSLFIAGSTSEIQFGERRRLSGEVSSWSEEPGHRQSPARVHPLATKEAVSGGIRQKGEVCRCRSQWSLRGDLRGRPRLYPRLSNGGCDSVPGENKTGSGLWDLPARPRLLGSLRPRCSLSCSFSAGSGRTSLQVRRPNDMSTLGDW